jgi:hypothetical protein
MVAFAAVAGLIATMAVPAHASTVVFHSSFDGKEAEAAVLSVSGCMETNALVFIQQGAIRTGTGKPSRETDVQVEVLQFDTCTSTVISDAFGTAVVPDSAFTIEKKLSSAQLNATLQITDSLRSLSYVVDVNVSWTGTGTPTTTKNHSQQKIGNLKFIENFHGTTRDAQASVTVTSGASTLISDTAYFATMSDIKESSREISRQ